MTSKVFFCGAAMALAGMLASCIGSSSSSTYTTYDDVAITSFTLGKVKCVRTVTKSDGTDSTYTYTYSGSLFPVHIDQFRSLLYNEDSLSVGSDLSRVLVTIGTHNGGAVWFKNIDDDGYTYYSSTDSVDLSQERILRVYSTDGEHSRDYRVNLAVHKEYADSFTWDKQAVSIAARLASFKKMTPKALDGVIYLLASDDANTVMLRSADGKEWGDCQMSGVASLDADASLAVCDGSLWLLSGGILYTSGDGDAWTLVAENAELAQILGGCAYRNDEDELIVNELYALSKEGKIMRSVDDGATWAEDDMGDNNYYDNTSKLPTADVNFVVAESKLYSGVGSATIVGNIEYTGAEDDALATAVVWNKTVDAESPQGWFFTNTAWNNRKYILPRMEKLAATYYADGIVAIGGNPINNSAVAFSQLYYSPDHGATWHKQEGMGLPKGFAAKNVATVVGDGNGFIYIITDGDGNEGQVWKGRKNSETWTDYPKLYQ